MPIYEYRCDGCGKRVTVLTLRVSETVDPQCDRCGSRELTRLMSRFAMPRSEEERLDALADPDALGGVDENDPKSMARWMRRMGQELGEDVGDDFDEMVDELEAGADADEGTAGRDDEGDAGGDDL
jgi:putative FmdB family regulatory protein